MTQPSRTTETINRDNAAIRDIMHQIRELTVPDRATLALGLIGHLATMMNRSQMTKLMGQLQEEAERVQDVPPSRQRDDERATGEGADARSGAGGASSSGGATAGSDAAASGRVADESRRAAASGSDSRGDRESRGDDRVASGRSESAGRQRTKAHGDVLESHITGNAAASREGVGQGGRGEFRSRKLL